jgi:hypothetical protein
MLQKVDGPRPRIAAKDEHEGRGRSQLFVDWMPDFRRRPIEIDMKYSRCRFRAGCRFFRSDIRDHGGINLRHDCFAGLPLGLA